MLIFSLTNKEDIANYLSQKLREIYCGHKCDLTPSGMFCRINDLTGKYTIINAEITLLEEEVRYKNGGEFFNTYQIRLQVETLKRGKKRWVNFNL